MRRWADTEPADPDLLFEVAAPRPHKARGLPRALGLIVPPSYTRHQRDCEAAPEPEGTARTVWLHGVDSNNTTQNSYYAIGK